MEQAAFLKEIIVYLSYIVGIIGVLLMIVRQRKKDKEKYATKEEVNKDFKTVHKRIDGVERKIENDRKESLEARKQDKKEITEHFDTRFEDFKDYMRDLINKSA